MWANRQCEMCPNTEFFLVRFSCIRTEYGEILRISPYLGRMEENTDKKKLRILTLFTQLGKKETCTMQNLQLLTSFALFPRHFSVFPTGSHQCGLNTWFTWHRFALLLLLFIIIQTWKFQPKLDISTQHPCPQGHSCFNLYLK